MRLEKNYHRPLENDELTLKNGYLNSDKKFREPITLYF